MERAFPGIGHLSCHCAQNYSKIITLGHGLFPSGCCAWMLKRRLFLAFFFFFNFIFIFNPNIGIPLLADSSFKTEKTNKTGNISVLPLWERCLPTSQPCSVHSTQLLASVPVRWLLIIVGQRTKTSTSPTKPGPCSSTLLPVNSF